MQNFYHLETSKNATGELSMSPAWTAIGHPNMLVSSPILRKKVGHVFLRESNESLSLLGSALWLLHPRLARRWSEIMLAINRQTLGTDAVKKLHTSGTSRLWPSPFTAMSIIGNKSSSLHRDQKGVAPFFDLLTTIGNYTDGMIHTPALGLVFKYNPGTLMALCGKVLAHEVPRVNGERVCLVQYFHRRPLELHTTNPDLREQQFCDWMDVKTFQEVCKSGHNYNNGDMDAINDVYLGEGSSAEWDEGGDDLDSGDESDFNPERY